MNRVTKFLPFGDLVALITGPRVVTLDDEIEQLLHQADVRPPKVPDHIAICPTCWHDVANGKRHHRECPVGTQEDQIRVKTW